MLPPIVAAFTSDAGPLESWPGVWIMATSPMMIASPTASGAVVWEAWLTAGEVLWSPRQQGLGCLSGAAGTRGPSLALGEPEGPLPRLAVHRARGLAEPRI